MVETVVAVVVKGYPRLSETFVAQELLGLEAAGLKLAIFSLRQPTDRREHALHRQIVAPVHYLPEYLWQAPLRVLIAWWRQRRRAGYAALRRAFWRDLRRDPTPNRLRRFGQALVLAESLPAETRWLYAHFLHTPAAVARYTALLTGLPWSCSAHAKDIWTTPAWDKTEKLAELRWLVTCTEAGRAHLAALAPRPETVSLLHHGLDLSRFAPPPARAANAVPTLLSVGRLVHKKGFDVLLQALARLPPALPWRLVQIGGGPLAARLRAEAERLGLAARIEWRGAQTQDQVLAAYRAADLFVLASRVEANGDRDGLPNVLMEAQSQRLACVASDLPGIAELILPGRTGLLVPAEDSGALADAIAALLRDPQRRQALGQAGEARVRACFDAAPGLAWLAARFAESLAPGRSVT